MKAHNLQKQLRKMDRMDPPLVYQVDLVELQGEGDFTCPSCGILISPEDETEEVYTILETKIKGQDLEALVIQCKRCKSKIRLSVSTFHRYSPIMRKFNSFSRNFDVDQSIIKFTFLFLPKKLYIFS